MIVPNRPDSRAIVAACLLSAAGALVFNAFPLFLSTIADQFGFGDEALGLLGTYYLGGFALVALLAPVWMPRLSWRMTAMLAYAVVVMALFWLATTQAAAVHWGMSLLGMASAVIFTIGLGVLSAANDPDRAYGFKLSAEMVLAAITMYVMTSLVIARYGYTGFLWGSAFIYGISALGIFGLPTNLMTKAPGSDSKKGHGFANPPVILASAALFLQFGTFSGVWGFMARFGTLRGVGDDAIGTILTLSLLCGLGGALACAYLGNRFGQRLPILLGMVVTISALLLLNFSQEVFFFAIAACLINALLQFLCAYQMGLITELDSSGRYTVMIAFILASSGAVGPGVMGVVLESHGAGVCLLICMGVTSLAMVLTTLATGYTPVLRAVASEAQ
ncbi:MAG: hypothetical protein V7709_19415 [Halioglobus sp.]